jgi:hypothetical protein
MRDAVTALLDDNTCNAIAMGGHCGDNARGYYHEFEYNGQVKIPDTSPAGGEWKVECGLSFLKSSIYEECSSI